VSQASHGILPATPGINQHNPLGRLISQPKKEKRKENLNNKQQSEN
jgi:hypothetical protein